MIVKRESFLQFVTDFQTHVVYARVQIFLLRNIVFYKILFFLNIKEKDHQNSSNTRWVTSILLHPLSVSKKLYNLLHFYTILNIL